MREKNNITVKHTNHRFKPSDQVDDTLLNWAFHAPFVSIKFNNDPKAKVYSKQEIIDNRSVRDRFQRYGVKLQSNGDVELTDCTIFVDDPDVVRTSKALQEKYSNIIKLI